MEIRKKEDLKSHKDLAIKFKKNFKIREGQQYSEMVFNEGRHKVLFNQGSVFNKGLFLFKRVRDDIEAYLEANGEVTPVKEVPVNWTNENYKYSANQTIGLDLNHAYWRVAYLKDYISEETYLKGLESDHYKVIRLSALSNLGRSKSYQVFEKGEYKYTEITAENKAFIDLYNDIRYTTFGVMEEIANELGNEFHGWHTDCSQIHNTKKAKDKAISIIEGYNLLWKFENV